MRRPVNKFIQLLALFSGLGVSTKQQFKDVQAAKNKPASLSMFAEGINPNALSMKRVKGKWRVKR